ncbi:hypothetical protein P12x_005780 [Tundrisphaera lichenicola]|uniref:hypothetical protein n=1 Tax=Tundrisphaera lichenicola TaxID=2029860 RepID=UPI003EB8FBEE
MWDMPLILMMLASALAACSALGGVIALRKKRRPTEGVLLGLFLGPIGVAVETRLPAIPRPEVCQRAWNSFRSIAAYDLTHTRPPRRTGGL